MATTTPAPLPTLYIQGFSIGVSHSSAYGLQVQQLTRLIVQFQINKH